jgi:hypothetical protein
VVERGRPVELEIALPDGTSTSAMWYHVCKQPWFGPGGAVAGVLDVGYDITSRVRAQQELLRRRDYLERLLSEQTQALKRVQDELARWAK